MSDGELLLAIQEQIQTSDTMTFAYEIVSNGCVTICVPAEDAKKAKQKIQNMLEGESISTFLITINDRGN